MPRMISRRVALRAATLIAACLLSWPTTGTALATSTTFSGRATAIQVTVLGTTTSLADTGALPSSGGSQEASLLSASAPGLLGADVLHASTIGQGDRSRSEASVASLNLTAGGNAVSSTFLMARATAMCGSGGASAGGDSEIADLVVNGQPIVITSQPNQTVNLPGGGSVIINEQTSGRPGDITVNAVHVSVPGVADVVVASAHADITCPPPSQVTCDGGDFVTGGGWISTPNGRANFAVAGGMKNGGFWGHLEYIDHGTGMKVKGTGVTKYTVTGATSRHIEGTAEVDGMSGTYQVDVADNGEPGRGVDTFSIKLSNGYTVAGTLSGGNIQLHTPCH